MLPVATTWAEAQDGAHRVPSNIQEQLEMQQDTCARVSMLIVTTVMVGITALGVLFLANQVPLPHGHTFHPGMRWTLGIFFTGAGGGISAVMLDQVLLNVRIAREIKNKGTDIFKKLKTSEGKLCLHCR